MKTLLTIILATMLLCITGCETELIEEADDIPEEYIDNDYLEEPEEIEYVSFREELIKVEADPDKGFYFPYYIFIPNLRIPEGHSIYTLVITNSTGIGHEDIQVHDAAALESAERGWENLFARKLNVPLLVPVFPRQWGPANTQALLRHTLVESSGPLARADLQLIAMINDAHNILEDIGINMKEQILMTGYSTSAQAAVNFTILHPNMVKAVAAGGINLLVLPVEEWAGERLRYDIGIADLEKLTGIIFDMDAYKEVAKFFYMGALDNKEANDVTMHPTYERKDAELIWRISSKHMPNRWEKYQQIYKEIGIPTQFKTYEGVGHVLTDEMVEDVINFFIENAAEGLYININDYQNAGKALHETIEDRSIAYLEPSTIQIGVSTLVKLVIVDPNYVSSENTVRIDIEVRTDSILCKMMSCPSNKNLKNIMCEANVEHNGDVKSWVGATLHVEKTANGWEGQLELTLPDDLIYISIRPDGHSCDYLYKLPISLVD